MPSLADLTDYDAMVNVTGVTPDADGIRRVYIGGKTEEPTKPSIIDTITNKLLGLNGQERYQLWPEKVVREGLSAAGDALAGNTPQWQVDPVSGNVHTSPQMIEGAQAMSALAGSGGLAGTTDATLGATPFLRPALKYKDRLYKGKEGQAHQDVIPDALYPEFQKMAMSGEDISHYNFGFHNDKGQFLTREKALEYGINTGIIDPAAGKFGALTSTLLADSSKPGMAIEATAKANAPQFYSALEHNVGKIAQDKMTGDQWLGTLANKPGVKPEELQWSGLNEFLNSNKGKPVTKEQIKSFLDENKTELGEKVYNQKSPLNARQLAEAYGENWDEMTPLMRQGYEHEAARNTDATKYSQYQVPGGENYREVLMTLPPNKPTKISFDEFLKQTSLKTKEEMSPAVLALEQKRYEKFGQNVNNPDLYRSSHWDEPNILAHMRMNDRTIDGKKSLHLEEVQSDWHQDGRKNGYKTNEPEPPEGSSELMARRMRDASAVPDAPFKKNWHELALKRAIREAAENGYDRLSWTAGEHHPTNPKNLNQKGPEADAADKGMQGFYNNMLPKSVEKLTGQKVHESGVNPKTYSVHEETLSNGKKLYSARQGETLLADFKTRKEAEDLIATKPKHGAKVYYIDLPQSVKDTALEKGFPLFSQTHMFSPVAGDPFKDENKK